MGRLQPATSEAVMIGLDSPDDAALISFPGAPPLLQTVDFFRAMVDDPYLFGRIAATHALGDIYAMGGAPESALAIATLPPARAGDRRARPLSHAARRARRARSGGGGARRRAQRRGRRAGARLCRDRATASWEAAAQGRAAPRRPADPDQAARHRRDPCGRRARAGAGADRRSGDRDNGAIRRGGRLLSAGASGHRLHRRDRVRPPRPSPRNAARLRHGCRPRPGGDTGARRRSVR